MSPKGSWPSHGIGGFRDPRRLEYGLNGVLSLSLFYAHCLSTREALILHDYAHSENPDIALLDRGGALWLYELKPGRMSKRDAAAIVCQLLSYGDAYLALSPDAIARLYCNYMRRTLGGFNVPAELDEEYVRRDPCAVLTRDATEWFGTELTRMGGMVSKLCFLASSWSPDAIALIEQVRSGGIRANLDLLSPLVRWGKGKWIERVVRRADEMEVLRDAEWRIESFRPPGDWIVEERFLGAV